ncbi:hypothetical protein LTR53_003563 [Teratosphaeriaceae sp. CCFEE 6253]|nr:hypothetical protein LTR53_003563 [Teratosphaeriaceae sp. CCFEE 6253]
MQKRLLYLLHLLNALIACLCIAILGLATRSIIQEGKLDVPTSVDGVSLGLLMWPGCGGVVDFLLFLFILVAGERRTFLMPPMQKTLRARQVHDHGFLFVGSFIFMRPFVVLIYEFVASNNASKPGHATAESWACNAEGPGAASLCTDLRAARHLLVPVVVIAAILTGTVIWVWLHRKEYREALDRTAHPPSALGAELDTARMRTASDGDKR